MDRLGDVRENGAREFGQIARYAIVTVDAHAFAIEQVRVRKNEDVPGSRLVGELYLFGDVGHGERPIEHETHDVHSLPAGERPKHFFILIHISCILSHFPEPP